MNGHRTPRRRAARSPLLSTLLLMLLTAVLATCLLATAGCGSDTDAATESKDATDGTAVSTATQSVASTTPETATQPVEGTFPVSVTDDNGDTTVIAEKPMRIVSTAPANTETLFALGVGDRVVGVSSLDTYPPEVESIAKIGDYQANTEAITALSPDLIVGYVGNEEALAPLRQAGVAVLILNPSNLEGIYSNISTVGAATGAVGAAADLVSSLKAYIKEIQESTAATGESPTVFYSLDNTLWTCGPGSFVDELLALANATNVASQPGTDGTPADAYYQFSAEQLVAADPDVILLPGSFYASPDEFTADPRFAGLTAVTEGRVVVIDDVVVTLPGPRIGEGLKILAEAVHPGAL